jgi:hypothetical protein
VLEMIRNAAAAILFLCALGASPAHATGDISCSAEGASVDMLVGRLQVLSILRVVITVGEETWSTDQSYAKGTPIAVGQAFEDDRLMMVDFMDDNLEQVLGRLRVVNLADVSAGAFAMEGKGSWIVDCSLRG